MIIIPELETIVILVPRTGSGSLYRAIQARYPKSMLLYRHMEADGIPIGYNRWRKVGVVRHPITRLWSLYNYIYQKVRDPEYRRIVQEDILSAQVDSLRNLFEHYLRFNQDLFPRAYRSIDSPPGTFDPLRQVLYAVPENKKSQHVYLRPDLGTQVYCYETALIPLWNDLGLDHIGWENKTNSDKPPPLHESTLEMLRDIFSWEQEIGYTI